MYRKNLMIMKKICAYLFAMIICFSSINSHAQNGNYYYNNGIEKYFIDDSTSMNIIVADTSDLVAISNGLYDYFSGEAKVSYSDLVKKRSCGQNQEHKSYTICNIPYQ